MLTNVVGSAAPFQVTTEVERKPVPAMSIIVSPDSAITLEGLTVVTTGTGLLTENDNVDEVPPPGPGFMTVNCEMAAFDRSLAGIVAVKLVAEVKDVATPAPFH